MNVTSFLWLFTRYHLNVVIERQTETVDEKVQTIEKWDELLIVVRPQGFIQYEQIEKWKE